MQDIRILPSVYSVPNTHSQTYQDYFELVVNSMQWGVYTPHVNGNGFFQTEKNQKSWKMFIIM